MSTIRVTQRQLDAYNFFTSANPSFIEEGAAAVIGNFCQESGETLDSTMFRARPDASGGVPRHLKSGGIAEWLGERKTACIAFSEQAEEVRGFPAHSLLNNLLTQCAFVIHELQNGDSGNNPNQYAELYRQLTVDTGRSIRNLTANFMDRYERPSNKLNARGERIDGLDNRIAHAEALYKRAQLIKAAEQPMETAPMPQPAPSAPLPQVAAPITPPPEFVPPAPVSEAPTISAATAGRRAADQEFIAERLAARRAERAAIDAEIAFYEQMGEDIGKLVPAPEGRVLPAQAAIQATGNREGNQTVFGIVSWKTTLGGIAAILTSAAAGANALSDGDITTAIGILSGIMAGIGLIAAKDNDVTGGTKRQ